MIIREATKSSSIKIKNVDDAIDEIVDGLHDALPRVNFDIDDCSQSNEGDGYYDHDYDDYNHKVGKNKSEITFMICDYDGKTSSSKFESSIENVINRFDKAKDCSVSVGKDYEAQSMIDQFGKKNGRGWRAYVTITWKEPPMKKGEVAKKINDDFDKYLEENGEYDFGDIEDYDIENKAEDFLRRYLDYGHFEEILGVESWADLPCVKGKDRSPKTILDYVKKGLYRQLFDKACACGEKYCIKYEDDLDEDTLKVGDTVKWWDGGLAPGHGKIIKAEYHKEFGLYLYDVEWNDGDISTEVTSANLRKVRLVQRERPQYYQNQWRPTESTSRKGKGKSLKEGFYTDEEREARGLHPQAGGGICNICGKDVAGGDYYADDLDSTRDIIVELMVKEFGGNPDYINYERDAQRWFGWDDDEWDESIQDIYGYLPKEADYLCRDCMEDVCRKAVHQWHVDYFDDDELEESKLREGSDPLGVERSIKAVANQRSQAEREMHALAYEEGDKVIDDFSRSNRGRVGTIMAVHKKGYGPYGKDPSGFYWVKWDDGDYSNAAGYNLLPAEGTEREKFGKKYSGHFRGLGIEMEESRKTYYESSCNSWDSWYNKIHKMISRSGDENEDILFSALDELDSIHAKKGAFKNINERDNERIQSALDELSGTEDYDLYSAVEDMADYFGWND